MALPPTEAFQNKSNAEVLQMTFESSAKALLNRKLAVAVGISYNDGENDETRQYVYYKFDAGIDITSQVGNLLDRLSEKFMLEGIGYFVAELKTIESKPGKHTLCELT